MKHHSASANSSITEKLAVFAAFAAALAAIFAAVFAWKQVELSREHNRLSVMPILQVTPYLEGKGKRNGLYLSNDGIGPGILKGFSVKSAGVTATGFESDRWPEILSANHLSLDCFAMAWPKGEAALKVGYETPLLALSNAELLRPCLIELIKLVKDPLVEVRIEYESIYGEKKYFTTNSKISSSAVDELWKRLKLMDAK